jgi:hypothetical protein
VTVGVRRQTAKLFMIGSVLPLKLRSRYKVERFVLKSLTMLMVAAVVVFIYSQSHTTRNEHQFTNSIMSITSNNSTNPNYNDTTPPCVLPSNTSDLCGYVQSHSECSSNQYTVLQYCTFGNLQPLYYILAVRLFSLV